MAQIFAYLQDKRLAAWLVSAPVAAPPKFGRIPVNVATMATRCVLVCTPDCIVPAYWPIVPGAEAR